MPNDDYVQTGPMSWTYVGSDRPNNESIASNSYDGSYDDKADLLTQLLQQNSSSSDALSMLEELAKSDPAYYELYAQLLAERENQERSYKWYEDWNSSYYQRTVKDLEAAGLNPWLALQSLGSGGSGSLSAAGSWSGSSGNTLSAQRRSHQTELAGKAISGIADIIGAIVGALVIAML